MNKTKGQGQLLLTFYNNTYSLNTSIDWILRVYRFCESETRIIIDPLRI